MHDLLGQWAIRLQHVSAISAPELIKDRDAFRMLRIRMQGGEPIEIMGTLAEIEQLRAELVQAVTATS